MKNILVLILALCFTSATELFSQITVGPEIGVSYLPFVVDFKEWEQQDYSTNKASKRAVFIFGLSAQVPFSDKWHMNMRLNIANRGLVKWTHVQDHWQVRIDHEIQQRDFNIEFSFLYKIHNRIHFGLGPTYVRKFDSYYSGLLSNPDDGSRIPIDLNGINFGINSVLRYDINRYSISFFYVRKLKDEFIPLENNPFIIVKGPQPEIVGKNRFDLTIGMKLFGYKKK